MEKLSPTNVKRNPVVYVSYGKTDLRCPRLYLEREPELMQLMGDKWQTYT